MSKPKGWLARESYRVLQGPLVFLLPTGSPSSVLRSWPPSAGPFCRLEEVPLSCLSKGRVFLGGCGHHRVTLIRDVKRDVGNLLLRPTLSSLRRRLQVEKSPVGTATELSAPEYLQEGNVLRPAPCALEARDTADASELMHLRLRCEICLLGRFVSLLELNELSPTWPREPRLVAGWR